MRLDRGWDERAEGHAREVRRTGPAWFDLDRAPWWLPVLTGCLFLSLALDDLLSPESAWDRPWAVMALALLIPAQLVAAYRLRRGIPIAQPWVRRKR